MHKSIISLAASCLIATSALAVDINFDQLVNDPATGRLLFSGTGPTTFTDVGGLGFDIRITATQNTASVDDASAAFGNSVAPGTVIDALELNNAASTVSIEFFATATTNPFLVDGVTFQFDDLDSGETITNFNFLNGVGSPVAVNTANITHTGGSGSITLPGGTTIVGNAGAATPGYADNTASGAIIDLTAVPISGFVFTTNPGSDNIFLSQGLGGDVQVHVVPFNASPMLAFGVIGAMVGARIRRRSKKA